jgi:1-aminocyclopropane-1-carboxylate deaminase
MLDPNTIQIQSLKSGWWKNIQVDVLRLDHLHPVVSGNKWFKLRYYLADAIESGKKRITTFGGAYSNHIVATAFACKEAGIKSRGIIRGEKAPQISDSLEEAIEYGMEMVYVSREDYKGKENIVQQFSTEDDYWINEGGYGIKGMLGTKDILQSAETSSYSYISCACGTGTTLAGLVEAALPHQKCIGISALKGHVNLRNDVMELLPDEHQDRSFEIMHDYHFGGYAKHPAELIDFMNELWKSEKLATDIAYTSKLVFAVKDLIAKQYFSTNDKLLVIHSGGLQGNRSLPAGTLEFL